MECPIVKRTEYQLIDIDEEGYCSLMDDSGETRDDLKPIDPDLEKEIRDKVENGEDALVCVLAVSTFLREHCSYSDDHCYQSLSGHW